MAIWNSAHPPVHPPVATKITVSTVVILLLMFKVTLSFTFTTVHLSHGLGRLTKIINCLRGLPNYIKKTAVSHNLVTSKHFHPQRNPLTHSGKNGWMPGRLQT